MEKKMKKVCSLFISAFLAGLLAPGSYVGIALAASAPRSVSAVKSQSRLKTMNQGQGLSQQEKGVKTFEVYGSNLGALVTDDSSGTAPTSGWFTSVELSSSPTPAGTGSACWVQVFDSSMSATNPPATLNEATLGKALMPPLVSSGSFTSILREYLYPKQFNLGLVVKLSDATCRATIHWARNGGQD